MKKSTWESHPDYPLICSSIERITDAYKSFKVKEIQETEEKPSSAVGNLRSKFKKLRSASARDLKEESVPTSQTIKILEKDETLFKVLTIAMRGMLIKEDNITGILTIIEECIQDKPSKARTLNTMVFLSFEQILFYILKRNNFMKCMKNFEALRKKNLQQLKFKVELEDGKQEKDSTI